ncbi:MAG: selenocysteine-specific translation elongation factor [Desulfobacterales bacterium]
MKVVTGIDTDRLKEEKIRGITIELGFASMTLPNGQHLGIVDVPGHEKFVKNMVAGATGIDMVALVIAADEGVMPQTREHMEICTLLNIEHGLIVLSKIDLVEKEWMELVTEDIKEFTRGTFLENSPIIAVSSLTGIGLPEFTHTLEELSAKIPLRPRSSLFRLPIDRVFSMKGFGTVITGTITSGQVQVGDTIMIYPTQTTSKVRGIQVHNRSVNEAVAGMRAAINFQGLEKDAVNRGEVISHPGALKSSYMLDVSFHFLISNEKSIKNRTRIRLHTGTGEVMGNLILLENDEVLPDSTALAQIRLDSPIAAVKDDRFVVRSYSPVRTVAGGRILNPIARKHKRFKPEIISGLKIIYNDASRKIVLYHLEESGYAGVSFSDLLLMTNMNEKSLHQNVQTLLSKGEVILSDKESRIFIAGKTFEKLKKETSEQLKIYHRLHPLKPGMPKEELKSKFPSLLASKLFNQMLYHMEKRKLIFQQGESVRLASHKVALAADQANIRKKLLKVYQQSGLTPPYFKELGKTLDFDSHRAKDILILLINEGALIKVKEDLFFHADAVNRLEGRLIEFLKSQGEITTPQFKEMTGISRKYVIPLIEYFDAKNVTIRVGDIRKLRAGSRALKESGF